MLIVGTVNCGDVIGTVTEADTDSPEPIQGAKVKAIGSSPGEDEALSTADGTFRILCVSPAGKKSLRTTARNDSLKPGNARFHSSAYHGCVCIAAKGAQDMAAHGVIVRRLNAIENLGSIDMLCTEVCCGADLGGLAAASPVACRPALADMSRARHIAALMPCKRNISSRSSKAPRNHQRKIAASGPDSGICSGAAR